MKTLEDTTPRGRIRTIMIMQGIDSPSIISRQLKAMHDITITPQGVSNHIRGIKTEAQNFYKLMGNSLYAQTAHEDFVMLQRAIHQQLDMLEECMDMSERETGTKTLKMLMEMRDYVKEDKVLMTPTIRNKAIELANTEQQEKGKIPKAITPVAK